VSERVIVLSLVSSVAIFLLCLISINLLFAFKPPLFCFLLCFCCFSACVWIGKRGSCRAGGQVCEAAQGRVPGGAIVSGC
jgi:hypothetical protein